MKKTMITGVLALGLIATGATGFYVASAKGAPASPAVVVQEQGVDVEQMAEFMQSGNFADMERLLQEQGVRFKDMSNIDFEGMQQFMQEQGINVDEMAEVLQSGNFEAMRNFMDDQNVNFVQMKPYMNQMHPELSDQELEELYKDMHGTGGATGSNNFNSQMGKF